MKGQVCDASTERREHLEGFRKDPGRFQESSKGEGRCMSEAKVVKLQTIRKRDPQTFVECFFWKRYISPTAVTRFVMFFKTMTMATCMY